MSNNVKQNPTKVITGKNTRWSYANVWEAKANAEGQTPKFSVSLIIPKDDVATIAKIKAAIKAAYDEGQSKLVEEKLKKISAKNKERTGREIFEASKSAIKNPEMLDQAQKAICGDIEHQSEKSEK